MIYLSESLDDKFSWSFDPSNHMMVVTTVNLAPLGFWRGGRAENLMGYRWWPSIRTWPQVLRVDP